MTNTHTTADKADIADTKQANMSYFQPLYPWQKTAWSQIIHQYQTNHLPHAILASGIQGIGKRHFMYQLAGFLLCQNTDKTTHAKACGNCPSCHWLLADTHPDFLALPKDGQVIKIDDIRALQDSIHTKNAHAKVIVLDYADLMTMGASNALLKILEEPAVGVYWLLISDNPSNLLPTIKSRVQNLPLLPIDTTVATAFLQSFGFDKQMSITLLTQANFAPLIAKELPNSAWYAQKKGWLQTLMALQTGKRSAMQASQYWQKTLSLPDFLTLTECMIIDIWRVSLDLPSFYADIDTKSVIKACDISPVFLENLSAVLDDIRRAITQNIQEKLAFDKILQQMTKP